MYEHTPEPDRITATSARQRSRNLEIFDAIEKSIFQSASTNRDLISGASHLPMDIGHVSSGYHYHNRFKLLKTC